MVSELDKIPYGNLPKMGMFARKVINTKQKLGLGVLKKVQKIGMNNLQMSYTNQL